MIVGQEKPSLEELQHFGIPGMRWGRRNALPPTSDIPRQITATAQVGHALRNKVGAETSRVLLKKYGGTAVRLSGKAAAKGAGLVFSKRAAKGSGIVLKLLGSATKGSLKIAAKGGKAYLKTAIAIGKLGFKSM